MEQQKQVSIDEVCQQVIQAKLNVYQAKEQSDAVLKNYNDLINGLLNLVVMMKARIVELEANVKADAALPEAVVK